MVVELNSEDADRAQKLIDSGEFESMEDLLAPLAISDVESIWRCFAERVSIEVADRVLERIDTEFDRIAKMPGCGHRRPDLTTHPVLFVRAYKMLIIYRASSDSVLIIAVVHGPRDLAAELCKRSP